MACFEVVNLAAFGPLFDNGKKLMVEGEGEREDFVLHASELGHQGEGIVFFVFGVYFVREDVSGDIAEVEELVIIRIMCCSLV